MTEQPKPKSFLTKLKEAVVPKRGRVVFPEGEKSTDVYPEPDFQDMTNLLLGVADVAASIGFINDVATGNGFEVTMNPAYTAKAKVKINDKDEVEMTAKEVVDYKCKRYGFDELAQEIGYDVIGFGNTFIHKGNKEKFTKCQRILPYYVQKVNFAEGKVKSLQLTSEGKIVFGVAEIDGSELVWLSYNHFGKDPLGVGILQALLTSYGGRLPLAKIIAATEKAMADQIRKFSSYNEMLVLEGVPDADVPAYNSKYQTMKEGARITTNKPARFERSIPERMRGLDFYVETLWNSFYLALRTPYPKLVLGGAFTEAAANAAIAVGQFRTAALQRYLKRVFETEFFDKWVEEEGLDAQQAQIRLHWRLLRMPDMSVLMSILAKFNELGTLNSKTVRKILIDMGLPIEEDEGGPVLKAPVTAETPPLPGQPPVSAEKKHEMTPREY